jgi:glycosyltransferase involved in cell wall biosynthesis
MKIAIIADPIDEQYAGIYVYAHEFIEAMERNNPGHELVYIHIQRNPFFKGRKELIVPLYRYIPLWATVRKFIWIPQLLKQHKFDIVHDLSHIAPFTFTGSGYKKVITIHDLTPVLFPEWHVAVSGWVHKIIFPRIFGHADLVLPVSANTKQDILKHYRVSGRIETVLLAARSCVKPLDRNISRQFLGKKYGLQEDYILYVGTLEPRKNVGLVLDIYCRLRESGVFDGKLVLAGKSGWLLKAFKAKLAAMPQQVRENILITGYVPEEELSYFYSGAELFLYPSLYEGFGLPPLEAMQCGCPVIAARNSSLTEVVGRGGICLPTDNFETWVKTATKILKDKVYRTELIKAGFKQSQTFSWDIHAQKVWQLYTEITG